METQETLVPIIFFLVCGAAAIFAIYARHRERITMLDKGLAPEDIKKLYTSGRAINPFSSLKWGMVFAAIGLAGLLGMWLEQAFMMPDGIYPALIALFGGLALVVFYAVSRRKLAD
jgi:sterol desaturase/sphingolipid hydroxylase (fatty acid hydroxylase superfamily)